MINANRFYWLAQFGGWTTYFALVALAVYTSDPNKITTDFFIGIGIRIAVGITATHIQRLIFIRLGWLDMRLPKLLPRLILSSFICSVFFTLLILFADYAIDPGSFTEKPVEIKNLIVKVLAALVLVLFWNAIYFTFHFFQKSRNQEISNLELAASKRESELKNLRSQLNPHFLFNALNSIRALVDIDPKKARNSLTTLSNLLRLSLLLGKENLVTIREELEVARSYLDLEKIRFEDRLKVEWEIDPAYDEFKIPPFSLQMMIENAIKHGISNIIEGGIVKVIVHGNEDAVSIIVENSGSLREVTDLGVGIRNVKQRLALQFGDGANFSLEETGDRVVATMKFKK